MMLGAACDSVGVLLSLSFHSWLSPGSMVSPLVAAVLTDEVLLTGPQALRLASWPWLPELRALDQYWYP